MGATSGDQAAWDCLVRAGMGWICALAHQLCRGGDEGPLRLAEELSAVGWAELSDVIKRWYDPSLGFPLFALARWRVKYEMAKARRRWFEISETVNRDMKKVYVAREELREILEREPTAEEIAERTGLPLKRVLAVLEVIEGRRQPVTLEDAAGPDREPGASSSRRQVTGGDRTNDAVQRRRAELLRLNGPFWCVLLELHDPREPNWDQVAQRLIRQPGETDAALTERWLQVLVEAGWPLEAGVEASKYKLPGLKLERPTVEEYKSCLRQAFDRGQRRLRPRR